ncbi:MAG TPA: S53 family peptidase [Streptosporangiaceae bacterium]|nr:S53 family peptidase [Streptosporangiaceae bacterium]
MTKPVFRGLIAALTAFVAVAGALFAAAAPSQAAQPAQAAAPGPPVALTASLAPPLPAGAVRLGTLAPGTRLRLEVALSLPDQARLTAFLSGLEDPGSPFYQRFLRPGQFGPRFGPSLARVAAVQNALRQAGLSPGRVSADRLSIPVTATAAAVERAFRITLGSYRLPGGRAAYANTTAPRLPAAVAGLVQGVLGLNDLYPEQHLSSGPADALAARPMSSRTAGRARVTTGLGPQPCEAASGSLANTANVVAAHYGMNLLYLMKDFAKGSKIGVLELEPNLHSDITAYDKCYGVSPKISYIKVAGGLKSGAGEGEAALDIEMLAGLAPKAAIDVYQAPNTNAAFYDIFRKFAVSDTDKILSVSWGSCEASTSVAQEKALETVFEQANAQGQSVFAAAGDEGSTSCFRPSTGQPDPKLSALSPAVEPYVLGVGGTSFEGSGASQKEIVWNDSNSALGTGAGGGGISSRWCMPGYQHQTKIPGIISARSKKDHGSSCKSKYFRQSPDLAAAGDPIYGYAVYYNGQWVFGGIGGTSAATPVWASVAALVDASPFCQAYGSRGPTLPQNFYTAVAARRSYVYSSTPQVLRDVTIGNNDYTPSGYTGGRYRATRGYDMASGLGVPMVSGLANRTWYVFRAGLTQLLCHQSATRLKSVKVTSVAPRSGPAHKKIKVKVHGSGFLPIASADEAQIVSGSKVLATVSATCTTTSCTVTLPAESARTVDIRIFAASLWLSPKTKADRFTYKS